MASCRAHLILKGPAAQDERVRQAVAAERAAGHELTVSVTYEAGDATRFAQAAARNGVDRVVAGGGDGTLNEVARGLLALPEGERPPLGILPLGTANDFARTCAVPLDLPAAALRQALTAPARPVDVGVIDGEPFLNAASFGVGAQIVRETPQGLKSVLGGAAYSVSGLGTLARTDGFAVEITSERFSWTGRALVVAIANARTAGGGYALAPRALLDDGLFDVLVVPEGGWADYARAMAEFGTEESLTEAQVLVRGQARALRLRCADGIPLNLDGEPRDGTEFEVTLVHHALRVPLGPGAPVAGEG